MRHLIELHLYLTFGPMQKVSLFGKVTLLELPIKGEHQQPFDILMLYEPDPMAK